MPTPAELKKIASLACIGMDAETSVQLANDVSAIIGFIEQLRAVKTDDVKPLFHPLDLHQRLRTDTIVEENEVLQLAPIAPLFEDDLYLVPKVIDIGN